ncbi:hypothetical protein K402DRAFT_365545 [Aulographum hederae CBS 113979]|uniref:Alpha-acetolactate decarboxylase n=1 Tax=Aulographum hederae CBS 113979 TaxID=1176131 RepID=A0A6G1GJR8_9PEZI|nr:hypothetical protein K402DRAFT_365545 [Aulographum hederae CBS 113979]
MCASSAESQPLLLLNRKTWTFDSDGTAKEAAATLRVPFVMVTDFRAQHAYTIANGETMGLRGERKGVRDMQDIISQNARNDFIPFTVTGLFSEIEVASGCLSNTAGTIFGISIPMWAKGISGPAGLRSVFISDADKEGKREGGEIVRSELVEGGRIEWSASGHLHVGMPRGKAWESLEMV